MHRPAIAEKAWQFITKAQDVDLGAAPTPRPQAAAGGGVDADSLSEMRTTLARLESRMEKETARFETMEVGSRTPCLLGACSVTARGQSGAHAWVHGARTRAMHGPARQRVSAQSAVGLTRALTANGVY